MEDLEVVEDGARPLSVDASELERVTQEIRKGDPKPGWKQAELLEFEAIRWVPPAVSGDGKKLLYVLLQGAIPGYAARRLALASQSGMEIRVALMTESLFRDEVLAALAHLDADVYVVDDRVKKWRTKSRHFMAAIADLQVPLSPGSRIEVGKAVWSVLGSGSKQAKGRRFEAFLSFLLGQVVDLRVVERNYRTATQEIDIVLQIDNLSNRVWQKSGSPLILVEAKNTAQRASQQVMSTFIQKLQTKRQSTRIGMLIAVNGFTADAKMEELRSSRTEVCVVMIDGDDLFGLLGADSLDDHLELLVRRALLR